MEFYRRVYGGGGYLTPTDSSVNSHFLRIRHTKLVHKLSNRGENFRCREGPHLVKHSSIQAYKEQRDLNAKRTYLVANLNRAEAHPPIVCSHEVMLGREIKLYYRIYNIDDH